MKRISLTSTKQKNKLKIKPAGSSSKKQLAIIVITVCAILILLGLVLFGKQFVGKAGETMTYEQGSTPLYSGGAQGTYSCKQPPGYDVNAFEVFTSQFFVINSEFKGTMFDYYSVIESSNDQPFGLTLGSDTLRSCCKSSIESKCVTLNNQCYLKGDLNNYDSDLCFNGNWITCTFNEGEDTVINNYALLCKNNQWQKCKTEIDGKIVVNNQLCINSIWKKCDSNYKEGVQTAADGSKYNCLNNQWFKAPKQESTTAMCSDTLDNDFDGYIDCADSDCKGKKFNQPGLNTCIQSSILNLIGKEKYEVDQNSLKPENLAQRSAICFSDGCVKWGEDLYSDSKCRAYFGTTSEGTYLCGKNNIWLKCTPEGEGTFRFKSGSIVGDGPTKICKDSKWVDYVPPEMDCGNNLDDDEDKLSDCLDLLDCESKSCGNGCSCSTKKQYGITIGFKKESICTDKLDNDGDKLTDCADYSDCESQSCGNGCLCEKKSMSGLTYGTKKETACEDKSDNDGDSKTDCADSDCTGNSACAAKCIPSCAGRTCGGDGCGGSCGTCAAGSYCQADGTCIELCNNNLDDDGDGKIDCFDDNCLGQKNSQNNKCCNQQIDAGGDGIADQCPAFRPICDLTNFICSVQNSEVGSCIHGFDDDGDGKIDCADTDCATDPNCKNFCSDTDKGKDYPTFGTVIDKENPKGLNDSCTLNGKLQEYFCLNDKFNLVTINCNTFFGSESKCVNGVCKCTSSCVGKTCGGDGCGGSCGSCNANQKCESNKCIQTDNLDIDADGVTDSLESPLCKGKGTVNAVYTSGNLNGCPLGDLDGDGDFDDKDAISLGEAYVNSLIAGDTLWNGFDLNCDGKVDEKDAILIGESYVNKLLGTSGDIVKCTE